VLARRFLWALIFALPLTAAAANIEIIGAGASFPAPVISAWAQDFGRETGASLRYLSVGSGEGIRRVTARTSDFAMTDVPLTSAELNQDDLLQFPVVAGAIVPIVNIPGVGDGALILTGPLLADIFLGKINSWDDPAIAAANPSLALPPLPIKVVHRSDGSGTSFVTYYLSKVSGEWRDRIGIGSRLIWPVGDGARSNEGVAQAVEQITGAIGYVEIAYAEAHHLATARLVNHSGHTVAANLDSVRAALNGARWHRSGFYEVLTEQEGAATWPIVGVSFALLHKRQEVAADAVACLTFMHWIHAKGTTQAAALHYVSLSDPALIARIEASWSEIRDERGQPVWSRK